jgi:hypothetical protein
VPRRRARGRVCPCRGSGGCHCALNRVVRGRGRIDIAAQSAPVSARLGCSRGTGKPTLHASACSWSKHMPSCTSLMRVCGSIFFANGSVSGSRIQHRESCSAALPKPASWRYRHTKVRVRQAVDAGARDGVVWGSECTEIVHRVAAQSLRHGAFRARLMRSWTTGVACVGGESASRRVVVWACGRVGVWALVARFLRLRACEEVRSLPGLPDMHRACSARKR